MTEPRLHSAKAVGRIDRGDECTNYDWLICSRVWCRLALTVPLTHHSFRTWRTYPPKLTDRQYLFPGQESAMPSNLGNFIRQKRTAAGIGLRELARLIGRSAPFLTQLELDRDPPPASEETLVAIARALREDPDELFARANKLPKDLAPESAVEVALYRKMKSMSAAEQKRTLETLEKKKPKRSRS